MSTESLGQALVWGSPSFLLRFSVSHLSLLPPEKAEQIGRALSLVPGRQPSAQAWPPGHMGRGEELQQQSFRPQPGLPVQVPEAPEPRRPRWG